MARGERVEEVASGEWLVTSLRKSKRKSGDHGRAPTASGSLMGMNSVRPTAAERIRYSWGVKECAAMGLGEVASGEWRVMSLRKRQIPHGKQGELQRSAGWLGWVETLSDRVGTFGRCAQDHRLGKGTRRKSRA